MEKNINGKNLKKIIKEKYNNNKFNCLDFFVGKQGKNFNFFERKMIFFARAILGKFKIVLIDNVNLGNDKLTSILLQKIIFDEFKESTVLNVINRKNYFIEKYHKILTFKNGKIAGFDFTENILKDENSYYNKNFMKE